MIGNLRVDTAAMRTASPGINPLAALHYADRHGLVARLSWLHEYDDLAWLLRLETADGAPAFFALREDKDELDGFAADVQTALASTAQQHASAVRLGEQCQYALMLASMSSVGAGLGPRLLARLVSAGSWSAQRALALARRMPSPSDRAQAMIAVLPALTHQAESVVDAVLAASTEVGAPDERARLIVDLLRALPSDQTLLRTVLSRALPSLPAPQAETVLSAAAASMDDDQLRGQLEAATAAGASARVRSALAARLPEPEREAVAAAIAGGLRETSDPIKLADGCVALTHLVGASNPDVQKLTQRTMDTAVTALADEAVTQSADGGIALEMLLPCQPPERQRWILAALRGWHEYFGATHDGLAELVDPSVVLDLVQWVQERYHDDPVLLADRIARLAPHAPPADRANLVALVVADWLTRPPSAGVWDASELEYVAPFLSDVQFAHATAIARDVPEPTLRVMALTWLAQATTGPQRDELADEALAMAARLPFRNERLKRLDGLAPVLDGERLIHAVAAARMIGDDIEAVAYLPTLFAAMTIDGKAQAWAWAQRATEDPIDEWRRIALLDTIAADIPPRLHADVAHLAETTNNELLRVSALTVAGSVTAALAAARALKPDWRCAELVRLALRARADDRAPLLAEAEKAVDDIAEPEQRVLTLHRLAQVSSGAGRDQFVLDALALPLRQGDRLVPLFAELMSIDMARSLLVSLTTSWWASLGLTRSIQIAARVSDAGQTAAVTALLRRCAREDDDRWLDKLFERRQSPHLAWELSEVSSVLPDNRAAPYLRRAVAAFCDEPPTVAVIPPDEWWHQEFSIPVYGREEASDYVLATITERVARLDPSAALPALNRLQSSLSRLRVLLPLCAAPVTSDLAATAMDAALQLSEPKLRAAGLAQLAKTLAASPRRESKPFRNMLTDFVMSHSRLDGLAAVFSVGPLWASWGGGAESADEVFKAAARVTRWWR